MIAAVGRMKSGPESELTERYRDRFQKSGRAIGFSGLDIIEISESRASGAGERKAQEATLLLEKIPSAAFIVALDETGEHFGSEKFSKLLARHRDDGQSVFCLAIGGADGHGEAMLKRANLVLSLGRMTWPHQLVRMLMCEQLYRAATILSGHPYHRV